MIAPKLAVAVALLGPLAACGIGEEDEPIENHAAANVQVSAEGKAEEGKISVKAPGFDVAFTLPKEMAEEARADRDSKILYPGAAIRGLAVAAGPGGDKGSDSEVEMRFSTKHSVDQVAAWYRDPARADGFRLKGAQKEGDAIVVTGIQKRDNHPFKVRLTVRPGGGTDGRLTVRHKD